MPHAVGTCDRQAPWASGNRVEDRHGVILRHRSRLER